MLNPASLDWIGVRFADPIGRVFRHHDGTFVRAIYPHSEQRVRDFFASGLVEALISRRLIAPMAVSDLAVRGYAMTIASPPGAFTPHLSKQPWPAIADAIYKWLEADELLEEHGLGLLDGHGGNFAMFGPVPQWVDLGSIGQPATSSQGLHELVISLVFPFMLAAKSAGMVRTARLHLAAGGLTSLTEARALGITEKGFDFSNRARGRAEIKKAMDCATIEYNTPWRNYSTEELLTHLFEKGHEGSADPRFKYFGEAVDAAAPSKAIDLGSASGNFAVLLARRGLSTLAVDMDEGALDRLQRFSRSKGLPITCMLGNALGDLPQRADFVSAMALTHHLLLRQFYPVAKMAALLADKTEHVLVTEFMPYGLTPDNPSASRPKGYTLEALTMALSRHFRHVQVTEYERPGVPRTLIVCRERVL
ncbi:MAG: class I SAM-dependent methyltransferase [Rhodospirillaceae bacterium]